MAKIKHPQLLPLIQKEGFKIEGDKFYELVHECMKQKNNVAVSSILSSMTDEQMKVMFSDRENPDKAKGQEELALGF
jgi:hypothetical protein